MSSISAIGLSALRVADMRMQAAASNIANAETVGRIPLGSPQPGDVYQPVDIVQIEGGGGGGVSASYTRPEGNFTVVSAPDSPLADGNGLVAAPNVDLAAELVNVAMARIAYRAATSTLRIADEMSRDAIDKLA